MQNYILSRLAAQNEMPYAKAADQLNLFLHRIIRKLHAGEEAVVPGLGKFIPGQRTRFQSEWPDVG